MYALFGDSTFRKNIEAKCFCDSISKSQEGLAKVNLTKKFWDRRGPFVQMKGTPELEANY
jgi:hypothetical protein